MTISVITPVYNREDTILRCIKSVANADKCGIEVEHIVVDDGSTDSTADIVERYSTMNKNLKLYRFKENKGTNAARNKAIVEMKGNYGIFLDSDDEFDKNVFITISSTFNRHNGYGYYLFVPDDMAEKVSQNAMLGHLANDETYVLTFRNFLSGEVGGDFIHLIDANILKHNPFREDVRIHEGVFFLAFYKEAERMLFTNTIVTHRERNRNDSVTRETIRTNKSIVQRTLIAQKICAEKYQEDYIKNNCWQQFYSLLTSIIDNALLLEDYNQADHYFQLLNTTGGKEPFALRCIWRMRCGYAYRWMLQLFLTIKYKFKKTLQ